MPETEPVLVRDQHEILHSGTDRHFEPVRDQTRNRGQHHVANLPPASSGRAYDELGIRLQRVQPHQHQPGQVTGHGGRAEGGNQLLGEEGVTFGAVHHGLHVGGVQALGMQRLNQLSDVGIGQRAQLEPADPREPGPPGGDGPQRVPPVQVVAAVGSHDRHGRGEAPGEQIAEQVQGGLVGPVQVLDHQQQRRLPAELDEHGVQRLEEDTPIPELGPRDLLPGAADPGRQQPAHRRPACTQPAHHLGPVRLEAGSDLTERQVRQRAATEVDAVSDRNPPPRLGRSRDQDLEQPGLPDASVPREQHQAGLGRPDHTTQGGQGDELTIATHEGRRRRRFGHVDIVSEQTDSYRRRGND